MRISKTDSRAKSRPKMKKQETIAVSQPYGLTNAMFNWTPLMCNIFGVIIYHTSVTDLKKKDAIFGDYSKDEYGHHIIDVPVKTLHGDIRGINKTSRDYKAILNAVTGLWNNPIVIPLPGGRTQIRQIITSVDGQISNGKVRLEIDAKTWDYLKEFDQYTKFDILSWLALGSFYSKRIVLLAKSWIKPMMYSASTLLKMFKLPDTYLVRHIIHKILEPAKAELDKKGEVSFGYKPVYDPHPKNGRPKIIGFLLWQIQNGEWAFNESVMIQKMKREGLASILEEQDLTALLHQGFRPEEIRANIYTLYHIAIRYNLKNMLDELKKELYGLEDKSDISIQNPKGYYIKRMTDILGREKTIS